jgi:branched-chain amino acid transport system substrate-binding protein
MRKLRILFVLLMAVMVVFSFAACTKKAEKKAEPIKIGAILAETGPASFLGGPEARTLRMLVDETNAAGGILGRPVEMIIKDSQANPENAISFAKQLIEEDKVVAILGPSTSGETMKIKGIMEEAATPLVSCAAAEVIVNPVAKYVFKTPQKDSFAVQMIYAKMKEMGIKKIGILTGNTGFGGAGKKQLEAAAAEYGLEIAISEVYDKKSTDLTAEVTKVKAAGVEAVVNWSIVPAQAIVAKNMKQIGLDVPLFQSHGFGNIKYVEAAGVAAEGIIFPAGRLLIADVLPEDHPQKRVVGKYKADYEAKNPGEQASTFGGHAYDAFVILRAAITKAGSTDKSAVRDAIESLQGIVGTGGVFSFSAEDHNGLSIDSFEMMTVKDGKFVALGN